MYRKLIYTDRLKKERSKLGYSYEEMANALGYSSKSTYMYIENGKTEPKLSIMLKISTILGKPVGYFFNLKVQENQTYIKGDR